MNSHKDYYKIRTIKKEKAIYIIYVTRNDSIFKIVSDKIDVSFCSKIKKAGLYSLNLQKIFPPDTSLVMRNIGIGLGYKGSYINLEEESHYTLYEATNLDGLCIKNEK
jgi:hypothetical protein